jgi:competence protein ComEC
VAGIAAAGIRSTPPLAAFGLAAAALGTAWACFARRRDRPAALLALFACACLGAARLGVCDRAYRANPLYRLAADGYVDIVGRLARSPGRELDRDILVLDVGTVRAGGRELACRGRLRLSVPFARGSRPRLSFAAGDLVRASARLGGGGSFRNFGAFSYERYLQGLGVHRRASTKSSLLVGRLSPARASSGRTRVSRVRLAIQRELERRFPAADGLDISPTGAVLEALLLGEDGRLDEATVENLQETGLYHLFAISGGHIAIITLLLFTLLRFLRLSRRPASLLLAVFLVFYTVLVEGSPSVLRATLMTIAVLAGRLLWRDVHVLNTIALSAFALLLANPFSLFDVGFELTYAATLAIILFMPPLVRRLPRWPLRLAELAAMSAAAALGAAPLIARSFNRLAFSSFLLNFPAIPLVGVIMGLGYAFLPVATLAPSLAGLPAALLGRLVSLFAIVSHVLDPFPFLSIRVPTPPGWVMAGYFAALGLSLVRPRVRGQRPALLAAGLAFAVLLAVRPFRPAPPGLRVTMIDVGQGESILVEFPDGATMVIDGGGLAGSPFDVGEKVVSPVLWRKGITRIDVLVLTHGHPDHLDGLRALARNFRIGEFWEGRPAPAEGAYAALLESLPARVPRRRLGRGARLEIGKVPIEVLNPSPAEDPDSAAPAANENSLVLRMTWEGRSFLIMGDAGEPTERALLEAGFDLRGDVLAAGHHGSATATSAAFLAAVRPRLVLVSVGEGNTYGFPSPAVLSRASSAGAEVLRTDLDGAVEVTAGGGRRAGRTVLAHRYGADPDFRLTRATKSMIIAEDSRRTFMGKKKWLAVLALPFLLASFLHSQSVVELAKKEKARREALKGKTATVITTADLAKVKKRPAVETANTEQTAEEAAPAEGQAAENAAERPQTQPAEADAQPPAAPPDQTEAPPAQPPALSGKDYQAKQAELAKAAEDKQEMVDLLTLKMSSLYQQFYSLDNMKSREMVQAQISDTYDKLLKAEVEAKQAGKDLADFLATAKKQETPSIWIK